MQARVFTAAVLGLAVYFAFGDLFSASMVSTPEGFVSDVGRGIGTTISGVATSVVSAIGI